MATYTHNYQIELGGLEIRGEILFNSNQEPQFKTTSGEEMTIEQNKAFLQFLESLVILNKCCSEILNIRIIRKGS